MPGGTKKIRYYCDYCDSFLTHDSRSVRKEHDSGYKHKSNVKAYYLMYSEEGQAVLDAEAKGLPPPVFMNPSGTAPPPTGAPAAGPPGGPGPHGGPMGVPPGAMPPPGGFGGPGGYRGPPPHMGGHHGGPPGPMPPAGVPRGPPHGRYYDGPPPHHGHNQRRH